MQPQKNPGFTLIELLIVVSVIAILTSLLLPTLAHAKEKAVSTNCQSNQKQLQLAWMMYADDYAGALAPNPAGPATGWVAGDMTNPAQSADQGLIMGAALGPYSKNAQIYRCPGDLSPHVRTVAMNPRMGNPVPFNDQFAQFQKIGDIPHPENYFVFIDERSDVIDDGYFRQDLTYAYGDICFWDWPASNHDRNKGVLSFADGHVEAHKWRDAGTCPAVAQSGTHVPVNKDAIWLFMHTSYATDGTDWPCDTCVIYIP